MIHRETIKARIKSNEIINITGKVEEVVRKSKIENGFCNIFAVGSTSGIIINEDEPMLLEDFRKSLDVITDSKKIYQHTENAFSHLRSIYIGNDRTVPIENGKLLLGTWQEIMVVNFDTADREREVVVTVMGE